MASVDRRAQLVGRRQHGLASRRQLRDDAGISAGTVRRRLEAGAWREVLPGVIDLETQPRTWRQSVMRLVLAAGPDAWASHWTAAHLHGFLDVDRPERLDVLVPRGRHPVAGGVRLRTTTEIAPDETTRVEGIPCTSTARTLADLAARLDPPALERLAFDLARRGTSPVQALAILGRGRGRPGYRRLRDAVARLPTDAWRVESPLEVRGLQAVLRATRTGGLPPPRLQHEVRDRDGALVRRVDAAWPERRVAVELDGAAYHDLARDRERDAQVRDRLRALGWEVVVVRAADLRDAVVDDTMRRLVGAVTKGDRFAGRAVTSTP